MKSIKRNAHENVVVILWGTKSDLTDKRVITFEEGLKKAEESNVQFFEISAKENMNIKEIFMSMCEEILERVKWGKLTPAYSIMLTTSKHKPCDWGFKWT